MSWVLIIFVVGACLALLPLIAATMSRYKKSAICEFQLVGSRAQVDAELEPEGTVLIRGELWRACSADGTPIASHTVVKVVGLSGHLLLVEPQGYFSGLECGSIPDKCILVELH